MRSADQSTTDWAVGREGGQGEREARLNTILPFIIDSIKV